MRASGSDRYNRAFGNNANISGSGTDVRN